MSADVKGIRFSTEATSWQVTQKYDGVKVFEVQNCCRMVSGAGGERTWNASAVAGSRVCLPDLSKYPDALVSAGVVYDLQLENNKRKHEIEQKNKGKNNKINLIPEWSEVT